MFTIYYNDIAAARPFLRHDTSDAYARLAPDDRAISPSVKA